jgi:methyl-accepting chemotaxis protein
MLRNLSLGKKLVTAFIFVALVCGVVGAVGIRNIGHIAEADTRMYVMMTLPLAEIGEASTHFQRMRGNIYELIDAKDAASREKLVGMIKERRKDVAENADAFEKSLFSEEGKATFKEFAASREKFREVVDRVIALVLAGRAEEAAVLYGTEGNKIRLEEQAAIRKLSDIKVKYAKKTAAENVALASSSRRFMLGLVAVCVGLALAFGIFLSRSISRSLNDSVSALSEGAAQVTSAAGMLSQSSQGLAEGSSEQAASLEETSSAMEEMSAMTRQNAENAGQAKALSDAASVSVRKANDSMGRLVGQMSEISSTSEEIGKIIKTIDEIAFQTNLLALNAAVEAARAGEAGAGFAVVADEVRNLAQRAAGAAKNTSELIEGAIRKIKDGTELVEKTNVDFSEVTVTVGKVTGLVGEVSAASSEQSRGISEVSTAISQMDKVTQQNASSSEEIASAAEEMNAQAMSLQGIVRDLHALANGEGHGGSLPASDDGYARPVGGARSPRAIPHAPPALRERAKKRFAGRMAADGAFPMGEEEIGSF